jgi:hypothetical protein
MKTEDDVLATLNFFFEECQKHGLNFYISKCMLFATMMRYCGRLFTKVGVCLESQNMQALLKMCEPQTGVSFCYSMLRLSTGCEERCPYP